MCLAKSDAPLLLVPEIDVINGAEHSLIPDIIYPLGRADRFHFLHRALRVTSEPGILVLVAGDFNIFADAAGRVTRLENVP